MPKDLTAKTFDYSIVGKDAKSKLIWYAGEVRIKTASHAATGLEMGRILSEANQLLPDQEAFQQWVERECGHSLRTAYNYMAAYEHFGSCANFAQIELSAMYALASNQKAKNKALKLIEKGIKVTHAMAQKLIAAVTPTPQQSEPPPDKPYQPPGAETESEPGSPGSEAPSEPLTAAEPYPDIPFDIPEAPQRAAQGRESGPPPRKLDRGAYYQQWDNAIAPVVKLVDKIAEGLGERHDPHQVAIQDRLNEATEEMMEWMGVEK
jgi:hypothetical protein